jgi:hypothetical protein
MAKEKPATNSIGEERSPVVGSDEVRRRELDEIIRRRRCAGTEHGQIQTVTCREEVQANLVGLALSGGGLRSGAFNLGVLQSLHEHRVLPFVDYLSTVSGGGYAGAYLSSIALQQYQDETTRRNRQPVGDEIPEDAASDEETERTVNSESCENEEPSDETDNFPIASGPNGMQKPRVLKFIHGGSYLKRTWSFFNRYLIGLFLIWIVAFSGLIAISALAAWLFRSLDYPTSRAWLGTLGFRGDVKLAFFPSFVLLIIWMLMWGVSYFKFGPRATGVVARFFFTLLVVVTLVAIAALFGNGETDFAAVLDSAGISLAPETVSSISTMVQAVLFSMIGVSLLPYFAPSKLLRSGLNPKNTWEKYSFWIASRALVYGVPFLFVAYFAQENISSWNDVRDSRLTRSGIREWNANSPLWRQVRSPAPASAMGRIWELPPAEVAKEFEAIEKSLLRVRENELAQLDSAALAEFDAREHTLSDFDLTFGDRWWYFMAYMGESLNIGSAQDNVVAKIAANRQQVTESRNRIAAAVNQGLIRDEFNATLLPIEYVDALTLIARKQQPKDVEKDFASLQWAKQGLTNKELLASYQAVINEYDAVDQSAEVAADDTAKARQKWAAALLALRKEAQAVGKLNSERIGRLSFSESAPVDYKDISSEDYQAALADRSKSEREQWTLARETNDRATLDVNRQLLATYYGSRIQDKAIVYSSVVLSHDQATRWTWFVWALLVFLIAGIFVDMNATSAHGFYSKRIGDMWIESVSGFVDQSIPLARLETTGAGYPYHLINCSLHQFGQRGDAVRKPSRGHFLFSKLYCGSDRTEFLRTADYMDGTYTLDDAVAVSGAAVSPLQTSNPLIMALLFLGNLRLGQWVANPGHEQVFPAWFHRLFANLPVTPLRVLISIFQPAESRPFSFVADGGHFENLGIGQLLKRRCRLIIASDAGEDGKYEFADLTKLMRWARVNHGVEIVSLDDSEKTIVLDRLIANEETRLSQEHFLVAKITYSDDGADGPNEGYLIYIKSTVTGDEARELLQFHQSNSAFPHDPSADQFYNPDRFESYRQLGYHIACQLCHRQLPDSFADDERPTVEAFIEKIVTVEPPAPTTPKRRPRKRVARTAPR